MPTTIVNSTPANTDNNGMGFLLGIIVFIIFIAVILFYGLPYIQRSFSGMQPQINVPDHVNVNIQKEK